MMRASSALARSSGLLARATWLASTPAEAEALGALLGGALQRGDAVLLRGAVAAGKSVFARGLVRGAAGDAALAVPSPTFLLQCSYPSARGFDVLHSDAHRLRARAPQQAAALLGLPAAWTTALCIVEWPQRLQGGGGVAGGGAVPPAARLDVRVLAAGARGYAGARQRALSARCAYGLHGGEWPAPLTGGGGGGGSGGDDDEAEFDADAVQPRAIVLEARGQRLVGVLRDASTALHDVTAPASDALPCSS